MFLDEDLLSSAVDAWNWPAHKSKRRLIYPALPDADSFSDPDYGRRFKELCDRFFLKSATDTNWIMDQFQYPEGVDGLKDKCPLLDPAPGQFALRPQRPKH